MLQASVHKNFDVQKWILDGDLSEASAALGARLKRDPKNAELLRLMAQVARLAGDAKTAFQIMGAIPPAQGKKPDFLVEKGAILIASGRDKEGAACLNMAESAEPLGFDSHYTLARFYASQGRWDQAAKHVQSAIGMQPAICELHSFLGYLLAQTGQADAAQTDLLAALNINPHYVPALWEMGNLLRQQSRTSEAIQFLEQALALRPNDPGILNSLGSALLDFGEAKGAIACFQKAVQLAPANAVAHSNLVFSLHYCSGIDPGMIAQAHRQWGAQHAAKLLRYDHSARRKEPADRRLKLGFVSADFRQHPVGRVAETICRHIARNDFEVFIYDNGSLTDPTTSAIRALASEWRSIGSLSDEALAKRIYEDGIDILIDLSGHTGGHRLLAFGRSPAPVQASLFAYPDTTGLDAMQFRITDGLADPVGTTESLYTEKLVRLPRVAWPYQPPAEYAAPFPMPALSGKPFTFGCLNNPTKVSEAAVRAWSRILLSAPSSRLFLLSRNDPKHGEKLKARFIQQGVPENQIGFLKQSSQSDYLGYHSQIDLMLDPFPYNGGITTADALWMGVPVLTLEGAVYVARQGVSLLQNLGLRQFVAGSIDEFVALAVHYSQSPQMLDLLRRELRERLRQSPWMDYAGYAADLSVALRRCWIGFLEATV